MSGNKWLPCPANEIPKEAQDLTWYCLMHGGQKANIPALKRAVNDLCHMATQMTSGKTKGHKKSDINFDNADWIMWEIVCEATALVLSGELDKLDGGGES